MTLDDILEDSELHEFCKTIVNNRNFTKLQAAFLSTVTKGEQNEHQSVLAHGKYLGTNFVFTKIAETAKQLSKTEQEKLKKETKKQIRVDPDLEE